MVLLHAERNAGPVALEAVGGVAGLQDGHAQQVQSRLLRKGGKVDILPDRARARLTQLV
jgi:hypothetical protein